MTPAARTTRRDLFTGDEVEVETAPAPTPAPTATQIAMFAPIVGRADEPIRLF